MESINKDALARLKRVHYGMMSRCYREGSSGYNNYGAKGAYVDKRWHNIENFILDVQQLPGWDEEEYVTKELVLDKDLEWGNKEYSIAKCRFITPEESRTIKPQQQYELVGLSPEGETYFFHSANGFAKEHDLFYNNILQVARKEYSQHKGWQFRFKSELEEDPFINLDTLKKYIVGLSPQGETYEFYNASEFSRKHGLLEATVIYACAEGKNTHTRGWQFRYRDELPDRPFKLYSELNLVTTRGKRIRVVDPDGEEYITNNKTQFAKKYSLNRQAINLCLSGKRTDYRGWKFYELW